jgi:hypothetical protein
MIPGIQSGNYFRAYLKRIVRFFGQSALKTPFLKRIALAFLPRTPALRARLRLIIHGHQTNRLDVAAYRIEHAKWLASCRNVNPAARSAKKQSEEVNGLQKTPLESYFY